MLKTASDFENSMEFLLRGATEEMNKGMYYQTKVLDSNLFNTTFQTIESRLNTMYEKTRVLEDVIEYIKTFVKQNIHDTEKECQSILAVLEEDRDKLKTNAYISLSIPLLESNGPYLDRDNSPLAHCSVQNSTITNSSQSGDNIDINTMEKKVRFIPYKSNFDKLKDGYAYRTFYLMDEPVNGGIREEVHIELETASIVNFIDLNLSQCKIENMRYTDEVGTIEYADNFESLIMRDRKIKFIDFTITSTAYKTSKYYTDLSRMTVDFWDTVKQEEYDYVSGGTVEIGELDIKSGIALFQEEYRKYICKIAEWQEQRALVANLNVTNGYNDCVPVMDQTVVPETILKQLKINVSPFNADPYPSAEQNSVYL